MKKHRQKDTVNHRGNLINSKTRQRTLPFNLSIERLTNNLNAIQSTSTKKSIDSDFNEELSNLTFIERSVVKSSYKIPNPTILLSDELPSLSNSNMIINKIQRSIPIDNNRNLLTFNQPNSFYLKTHSTDNTEDRNSTTSINSLNFIHKISSQQIQISHHDSTRILSQDLKSSSFKLHHDEFPTDTSPFEISPKIKIHHEIKPESESLWKTKLTLKTLLSMANIDEAQSLKNRKPIDYHMFLSSKFNKNSILQFDDTKLTTNNKQIVIEQHNEQDYKENRKLYKRLLDTMRLRKPVNTKKSASMTSIKQIKTKRRTKLNQENIFPLSDDFIKETEKPVLITYQAIPISRFNK